MQEQKNIDNQTIENDLSNMIVTTTDILDGYFIEDYLGIVFGEVVYGIKVVKAVEHVVSNVVDALKSFVDDVEYSGSTNSMREAKEYALKKMMKEAYDRGANAIVGVECDTTHEDLNAVQITMTGTAVRVRKKDM